MHPVQRRGTASTDELPVPGRYRHFKGSEYQVLSVARHSETEELLAVYVSIDDPDRIWVRPAGMFNEEVDTGGSRRPRFELTEPSSRNFFVRALARFTRPRPGGNSQALPR